MEHITEIARMRDVVKGWKMQGLSVGLVPTMGFLHEGHQSLIDAARKQNDKVAVSIFVNPMQFGPNEDYEAYPRDMKKDLAICEQAGADAVFAPTAAEMYPIKNNVYVDVNELGDSLCGAARPGHFRGVCTVVAKLFHIVTPDKAYFGEKDAQQLAIIKRMVSDLNFGLEIVPCPIIREKSSLAMSSRNTYLSEAEKEAALVIPKSLESAKRALLQGERNAETIKRLITGMIEKEPLAKINYVEVADALNLKPVSDIIKPVLVAAAVYIGKTRLIDNFTFREV